VNKDTEDLDAIIDAIYECMSFDAHELPDYERFGKLFSPGACILPPSDDDVSVTAVPLDAFIAISKNAIASSNHVAEKGFREWEINRITNQFGSITQVFSTYESEVCLDDSVLSSRGINGIQLVFQANRWWIISLSWDDESPKCPVPDVYLPEV